MSIASLDAAARASLRAPSIFNTQPWTWRIGADAMELCVAEDRRLRATDPDGRLLLLSCGAALHHARVALAAEGWAASVTRFRAPETDGVLARVDVAGRGEPDPAAQVLADAIERRRTDRRAFGDRPVSGETLTALRQVVEAEGAFLHVVPREDVPMLGIAAERAADAESYDPAYQSELEEWTHRPASAGDGVPPATAVAPSLRRVPVRDFGSSSDAGPAHDEGAEYAIIYGDDFLRAGEALSALLLTATAQGLSTAPFTEAFEIAWSRALVSGMLSGLGEPCVAVRLGYVDSDEPLPESPRRSFEEAVTHV